MFHEWLALMIWQGPLRGIRLGLRHLAARLNPPHPGRSVEPFRPATAGAARLVCRGGVPVAHFYGSPEQMGGQHGRLLGEPIRFLHEHYIRHVFGNPITQVSALRGGRMLMSHCPPAYTAELTALARAAGVSEDDLVLQQTFPDTGKIVLCTALAVDGRSTVCGRPMMARNLDFPSFGVADRYSLTAVFHPDRGYAFAAVTWPGMFGVLSGMNQAGLSAATMQVYGDDEHFNGMPGMVLYREVLNKCRTTAEARDYLTAAAPAGAANLMIMDATGAATVAELNPAGTRFREPRHGGLFAANRFHDPAHRQSSWWCPRTFRLRREFAAPRRRRLRDLLRLLHGVNQGRLTLQSMVFFPAQRRLLVSLGEAPTTRRAYQPLDLAAEFAEPPAA